MHNDMQANGVQTTSKFLMRHINFYLNNLTGDYVACNVVQYNSAKTILTARKSFDLTDKIT